MADKYAGGVKAGSIHVSTRLVLRSVVDGTELTGKVAADLTASYCRQGQTRMTITLADLAAIDSPWASGGIKEDADGNYRVDLPDTAVSAGADYVEVLLKCAGTSYVAHREIPLETKGAAEVFAAVDALSTLVTNLVDPLARPVPGNYDAGTAGAAIGQIASVKTVTDHLATALELSGGTYRFTTAALTQLLQQVVEGTVTVQGALRLANAANGGKVAGGAGTTVTIRDLADAKNRVSATVDQNGNRSAVTLDLT